MAKSRGSSFFLSFPLIFQLSLFLSFVCMLDLFSSFFTQPSSKLLKSPAIAIPTILDPQAENVCLPFLLSSTSSTETSNRPSLGHLFILNKSLGPGGCGSTIDLGSFLLLQGGTGEAGGLEISVVTSPPQRTTQLGKELPPLLLCPVPPKMESC